MKLAVVVIHGMGSQQRGFSNRLVEELSHRVDQAGKDSSQIAWEEIYWQDITERLQQAYLQRANRNNELDWSRLRSFVATALGDAAAYQYAGQQGTYVKIHERIRDRVKSLYEVSLDETGVPLVVMAHSLGGHIMSNYIWDMQHQTGPPSGVWAEDLSPFEKMSTLAGMITFGSNIPLFTFALSNVRPIEFPAPELDTGIQRKARWLNFFDPDDVLGYPLKPISDAYDATVDDDIPIDVGNILVGWNPASHTGYWSDNDFTKPVAEFLAGLI